MTIDRRTPLDDLPELLRADEVAVWLACSAGVVYDLCRRGDLPSIRLGRLLRVRRDGLAALAGRSAHTGGHDVA